MQTHRRHWIEPPEPPSRGPPDAPVAQTLQGVVTAGPATLARSTLKRGRARRAKTASDQLTYVLSGVVHVSARWIAFQAHPGQVFSLTPGERYEIQALQDAILLEFAMRPEASGGEAALSDDLSTRDARLARALEAFETRCSEPWTVARLAREAGMSRSAFAAQFHEVLGAAPLEYLTRWRLARIHQAVATTTAPLARIAAAYGYRSRSACSQAFRRAFGYTPQELRTRRPGPELADLVEGPVICRLGGE